VHEAEVARIVLGFVVRGVRRRVAVRSPHALERAGGRIEHDDAPVAVSIRDEHLVRGGVHIQIGAAIHVLGVGVARARLALADLEQESAVARELEDLVVAVAAAREPDIAVLVHVDAVLGVEPLELGGRHVVRAAPSLDVVPVRVELEHRRRRASLELRLGNRAGAVEDPDVVLRVARDPGGEPEHPIVRHGGPGDRLVPRYAVRAREGGGFARGRAGVAGCAAAGARGDQGYDDRPVTRRTLQGSLLRTASDERSTYRSRAGRATG
jgi:hypothetical protein